MRIHEVEQTVHVNIRVRVNFQQELETVNKHYDDGWLGRVQVVRFSTVDDLVDGKASLRREVTVIVFEIGRESDDII